MAGSLFNKIGNRLPVYIRDYGIVKGLQIYRHFKKFNADGVAVPGIRSLVFSRGIYSDMEMFQQIFLFKDYNIDLDFTPRVIVDLGANVGYASLFFANKFPSAKIIAVEPDEDNLKMAEKNLSPYQNITLKHGAIWHQPGLISLHDEGHGEAAYVVKEEPGEKPVRAYTIRGLMDEHQLTGIDLLKIDIEGTEKEIFSMGYDQWLPNTRVVIVETHDRYKKGTSRAIFSAINQYDFDLEVSGENLVFYNRQLVD